MSQKFPNLLHASLNYRRVVSFEMHTIEFLRVGESKVIDIGSPDLPILKIKEQKGGSIRYKPIIPGSSIKGAVRSEYSRVLSGLPEDTLKSLFGYSKLFTEKDLKSNYDSYEIFNIIVNSMTNKENNEVGLLDLLFGSDFFASPTIFTDAIVSNEAEEYIGERYHIRIDVDRDAVMENSLLNVEAVYPGTRFTFKIIYNSLDFGVKDESPVDKAFNVLVSSFLDNREMFLGGFKSRGYGLVRLKKIDDRKFTPEELVGVKNG
ncbi:hypothetical protein GFS03_04870 [Sulfolobus sp. E5-1-F]|uniref:RAMP superfamily CRISPR-associated protein n=1 Tax=Saccharolobus sp. E5-1-F TaxID=2663019 RepID=UPI001296893E|nr:RAMP superfamily CRISPR-associated protein [Sulfolobus sp. E5-1-F]QGA53956.1 hypothetical protein GFS03_04870 [Sulfolobus sp. E5-1-F]